MTFTVAKNFFEAVRRLAADDQDRALEFIGRFMEAGPAAGGRRTERLTDSRSDNVWSTRVTDDLRAILFKEGPIWHLLHIDRHDAAYLWAERVRVEKHVATGALQIIQSTIKEEVIFQKRLVPQRPGLLDRYTDDYLLSLGAPADWIPALRTVVDEDELLDLIVGLPEDVYERLFNLASGQIVAPPVPVPAGGTSLDSPDTRRHFHVVEKEEDLRAALAAPLATWVAFLHPTQRSVAEGHFSGPVKVTGSAGTGKTVVAMHRARFLARQGKRVLLTTFANTLAENLKRNLRLFCTPEELDRIAVGDTLHSLALRFVQQVERRTKPVNRESMKELIEAHAGRLCSAFDVQFLLAEWEGVISPQGILTWADYLKARRTGRGRALSARERKSVWTVMEAVHTDLERTCRSDFSGLCRRAAAFLAEGRVKSPYDSVVVDEVQDLSVQEIRFLTALAGEGPDRLLVVGDAGQRIYPGGFSLKALGLNTVGRSIILRLNYRTTEQIRRFADRLLGESSDDLDGGTESRTGTRSLVRGPEPYVQGFPSVEEQVSFVVDRVSQALRGGLDPEDIALFARRTKVLDPFRKALEARDIWTHRLQTSEEGTGVRLGSMHRAKGLEFKVVFVVEVSNAELPSDAALESAGDPADWDLTLANEKRLLYVAATRARDELFITWTGAPSTFLTEVDLAGCGTTV